MQVFRKQIALLTSIALLSTGTITSFPIRLPALTACESITDFARKLADQKQSRNESDSFAELRYSEQTQQLYRDGKPFNGSIQGFQVIDGALMYSKPETGTLSQNQTCAAADKADFIPLEAAAETIGCEIETKNGETVVRSPFQTARLIVRANHTPALHGASSVTEGYRDLHVLQYETPADAYAAYQALSHDAAVLSVEPDRIFRADIDTETTSKDVGPHDRWGIEAIGADSYRSWLRSQKETLPELRVAVIDTGLYAEHSWMEGRVAGKGASFVSGSNGTNDDNGHGSHCSGIIVSSTPENVKILPVKVLGADGSGSTLSIYCGMMYALEQGVDAASMSLGGWGDSGLYNAAAEAFAEADIPLAVSAGNDTIDAKYKTPAMCPSAITVSAVGKDSSNQGKLELASFSNFGMGIDFAAPGVNIESMGTYSENATVYMDGTSMATPFVAACIADILSYDPTLTNDQIYTYLKANAIDIGDTGFDTSFGWGLVNLDHFCFSEKSVAAPVIHNEGTTLTDKPQRVKLTAADKDAAIYYTLDGSEPTAETGLLYNPEYGGVWIDRTETLQAIAVVNGLSSKIASVSFKAVLQMPSVDCPGTFYENNDNSVITLNGAQQIQLKSDDNAAYYFYTLDGSVPQPTDAKGIHPHESIPITEKSVLTVRIQTENGLISDPFSFTFEVYAESPTFSLTDDGKVMIQTYSGSDAIYYTLDGSEPVPESSFLYKEPFALTETTHVRAISVSGNTVSKISDYAHIVDDKDIPNALVIENGVLVSYRGILTSLDLSGQQFTEVGENAFAGNCFLNSVKLPITCTKLGAYAFSDMQALMEITGGSITEISEGTFKDSLYLLNLSAELTDIPAYAFCNSGMPLKNAKIKTVGDYGLYNNPMAVTNENGILWEGVESIGNYGLAFSDTAGMLYDGKGIATGKLNLKSLKTVGKYAFSRNNNIAELTLPDTLTTAPEGLLMGIEGLTMLKASGITELDDYAFAFTPESPDDIAVDFSKITRLGKQSFRGFIMLNDVEFTALTALGEDSFSEGYFRALSFPAITAIPSKAFATEQYIDALYFENAETVEKNAFVLEPIASDEPGDNSGYGEYTWRPSYSIRYIIFGSKLKSLNKNAFAENAFNSITALAAPKDSPVFRAGIPLQTLETPTAAVILESDTEERVNFAIETVPQNADCILRAIPLGFRIDLQWYELPGDQYSKWLNGTPIPGETGSQLIADTSQIGQKSYCAAVISEGAVGNTSDTVSVNVVDVPSAGTATTNAPLVLDYTDQTIPESCRYISCTFTPETDGSYFFTRGIVTGDYIVIDADGSTLSPQHPEIMNSEFLLEGGKEYTIYIPTDSENRFDYFRILPESLVGSLRSVNTTEIDLSAPPVYMGKPVLPECFVLWSNQYQRNPETGMSELKDPVYLTQDKDYILRYEEYPDQAFGRIYVFGSGDYTDFRVFTYEIAYGNNYYTGLPKLTAGTPLSITDLNNSAQEFLIQPAKTGYYALALNYTQNTIEHFFGNEDASYMGTPDPTLSVETVTKNGTSELASDDDNNGMMMPRIDKMYLEKGKSYIVRLTNSNGEYTTLHEAELLLETAQSNPGLIANTTPAEDFQYQWLFYTGKAQEPECFLTDSTDGTSLTCGVDYEAYYFNNIEPGYMNILIVGKGRYRGYSYVTAEIRYDHWNAQGNVTDIEADEAFTIQSDPACCLFTLAEDSYVSLEIPENASFTGLLQSLDPNTEWELWENLLYFSNDTFNRDTLDADGIVHHGRFLNAGTYYFVFHGTENGIPLTLHIEEFIPNIAFADCQPVSCKYTGEVIHPDLKVTYGDMQLKEGTDYEIILPEGTMNCGIHTLTLRGIGRFTGILNVDVTVCPSKELANGNTLKEGRTTASITAENPTASYLWTPTKAKYALSSDQICGKTILIYEPVGSGTYGEYNRMFGIGAQSMELTVTPGKTYLVTASFTEPNVTGDLTFDLSSTAKMLYNCEIDGPELIVGTPENGSIKPEYRLMDGEKVLEPGKDYIETAHEGDTEYGRANITLSGIGDYTGTLVYEYYIAPESPETVFGNTARNAAVLTLNDPVNYVLQLPGYSYCSRFTASKDGTYYLTLPRSESDGATAFVYDNKQTLLPLHTMQVKLKKGEAVTIMTVTDFAHPFFQMSTSYSVMVSTKKPEHNVTSGGFELFITNEDKAIVTGWDNMELYGIEVPDTFYDPEFDSQVTFASFSDWLVYYTDHTTIFCKSGSKVEEYCSENFMYYLVTDSKSTLKGDITGDGLIDLRDAEILQRWLTELNGLKLPDFAYTNADMNGDGSVDILDVTSIHNYITENGIAVG